MNKSFFLVIFFGMMTYLAGAKISPIHLQCEYLENPSVVDVVKPRLSWVNMADKGDRGQVQTAWEIRVAGSKDKLLNARADLWTSGKVVSNQSVNIQYDGKPLTSRQDCWWQVRTWDKNGEVSEWSEPAFWSMGLLKPEGMESAMDRSTLAGRGSIARPATQEARTGSTRG